MTAPCLVFLVGEGPNDIGDLAKGSLDQQGREGFFQPLLRTIAQGRAPLEFRGKKLHAFPKQAVPKPPDVLGRKARQALVLAGFEGTRALVLAVDTDKESGTKASKVEARRSMREKRQAIEEGFTVARDLDASLTSIVTLVAIPCRMIEAWALADAKAIAQALDRPKVPVLPPGSPEEYWGDEQIPASNYPKCVLARAVGDDPPEDLFALIAAHVRLDVLEKQCPESFAPFLAEARQALDRCVPPETLPQTPPAARKGRKG